MMTQHIKISRLLALASVSLMIVAAPIAHAQSSSSSVTDARDLPRAMPSGDDNGSPDEKGDGPQRAMRGDANQDGFLSKDEMAAEHQKRFDDMFSKADADKDGKLSPAEMREGRKAMRAKIQERMGQKGADGERGGENSGERAGAGGVERGQAFKNFMEKRKAREQ